jgi:hypothetical protein
MKASVAAASVVLVLGATALYAQFRGARFPMATRDSFDGAFQYCRTMYRGIQGGVGGGWSTDYPDADLNFSTRLGELTKTPISRDKRTGEPNHVIVPLTDPLLFRCPFIMMFEVGNFYIDENEARILREYLQKGGFLWVDDFWGSYAWDWWVAQFSKVLPPAEYPIIDLQPNHPLFASQFQISKVPQIASIGHWASTGGGTSERYEDSAVAHARAVVDKHNNIMVLMTHNTDLGDSFEREADDPQYFYQMSVPGYAFGVNTLLYALTH